MTTTLRSSEVQDYSSTKVRAALLPGGDAAAAFGMRCCDGTGGDCVCEEPDACPECDPNPPDGPYGDCASNTCDAPEHASDGPECPISPRNPRLLSRRTL